jgi:hypothetical protein
MPMMVSLLWDSVAAAKRQEASLHARWHEAYAIRRASPRDLVNMPLNRGARDAGEYLRRK